MCCAFTVLQRWYEHNGYTGRRGKTKGKKQQLGRDMANMSDKQIVALFTRFFQWWVVEGRPGDTVKGGPQVRISNHIGSSSSNSSSSSCCSNHSSSVRHELSNTAVQQQEQQQQQQQLFVGSTSGRW